MRKQKNKINKMENTIKKKSRVKYRKQQQSFKERGVLKDTYVLPKRSVKSFLAGSVVTLFVLVAIGGVFATFYIGTDQIVSAVAEGTAPFVIASNTSVANLNADLLDGFNASSLQDAPTDWTCTVRTNTGSDCDTVGGSGGCAQQVSATCSGSEKVVGGGCESENGGSPQEFIDASGTDVGAPYLSRPTDQGWECAGRVIGAVVGNQWLVTYANCCS